ncbi:hypothetical protein [Streptomyces racemochromogenes]|uniref:hypothetical protein n=1 Tax=Streptomyces racemochromogenes TaxID=67353 RepID=UPI0031EF1843
MSAREMFLAHVRSILWRTWSTSPEELASAAVDTLMGLGMLVPEGGAQELDRLRLLADAQPADLSDEQVEALANAANAVWADANHDDLCACDSWPAACANGHWVDEWRSGAVEVGMRAVIGLWESMRAEADELARLRDRVAELEAASTDLVAERDAQIVAWLGKKSREYGSSNRDARAKSEAVWRMADKLGRGAVPRPLEDPHDSPLHHTYRVGRELPEVPRG